MLLAACIRNISDKTMQYFQVPQAVSFLAYFWIGSLVHKLHLLRMQPESNGSWCFETCQDMPRHASIDHWSSLILWASQGSWCPASFTRVRRELFGSFFKMRTIAATTKRQKCRSSESEMICGCWAQKTVRVTWNVLGFADFLGVSQSR